MLASNLPFFFFHFFLLLPPLLPPSVLPQPIALATVFSVQCVFTLALLQASPVIRAVIITQASKQVQVQAKAEVTLAIRNGALFIYLLAAICLTGVAVSFVYAAFLVCPLWCYCTSPPPVPLSPLLPRPIHFPSFIHFFI